MEGYGVPILGQNAIRAVDGGYAIETKQPNELFVASIGEFAQRRISERKVLTV
jgi:hypothetical protein